MSLISEALKKARQEAARQDAARQGVPYAVGSTEPQAARNTFLMVLAGLGAGCLLAGGVFTAAFFGGWGPFAGPQAAPAPQVAQAPPPPAAAPSVLVQPAPAPVEVQEEEEPLPVPPLAPQPQPQPQQAPPSIEVRPTAPAPQPEPVPAEPPPAPVEEEPPADPAPVPDPVPAAPATGGLVEGRTYAGEVPVPGGGTLRLNGIAFSAEHPVVVLDGRVMGTGEVVQGFTVVEIEAGRVTLEGHGATVYVSPK